ncbi:hypothetical protein MTR67_036058 [Solanum verrucosum]|uniref:Uncharacterized protein n=1 Tax=Solanum verrucosum TaxID=315347 RepID=A0AAF0UBB3_SOLVR|nr:hypothetical protein MTR67_036058 [Solanum verrucosum]
MWSRQGRNIKFRRLLNDWEVDGVANLLQRLEDFPGLNTNPDAIKWKHDRDGEFSVGRMYQRDLATHPRGFLDLENKSGSPALQPR